MATALVLGALPSVSARPNAATMAPYATIEPRRRPGGARRAAVAAAAAAAVAGRRRSDEERWLAPPG